MSDRNESIERQCALKAAVEIYRGSTKTFITPDVMKTAALFAKWIANESPVDEGSMHMSSETDVSNFGEDIKSPIKCEECKEDNPKKMTQKVIDFSAQNFEGKIYCFVCQKKKRE